MRACVRACMCVHALYTIYYMYIHFTVCFLFILLILCLCLGLGLGLRDLEYFYKILNDITNLFYKIQQFYTILRF